MVLENIVVIGVGDEQVVAVLAGLVVGAAGNLERKAVVEAGEDEAKGLGGAAGKRLMVSLMSLRVSGRSFSGWLSALETVPSETPASRATSLIFTFAIAAPLMRFKYKPDCSIPNLPKRDRFVLAGFIWGNAVASATTTKGTDTFVVV